MRRGLREMTRSPRRPASRKDVSRALRRLPTPSEAENAEESGSEQRHRARLGCDRHRLDAHEERFLSTCRRADLRTETKLRAARTHGRIERQRRCRRETKQEAG